MYTSVNALTYNNTLLVYPNPLGVSVNVTCIVMNGGVNYSQSVILHGMVILYSILDTFLFLFSSS